MQPDFKLVHQLISEAFVDDMMEEDSAEGLEFVSRFSDILVLEITCDSKKPEKGFMGCSWVIEGLQARRLLAGLLDFSVWEGNVKSQSTRHRALRHDGNLSSSLVITLYYDKAGTTVCLFLALTTGRL